jgi:hypothetical protein
MPAYFLGSVQGISSAMERPLRDQSSIENLRGIRPLHLFLHRPNWTSMIRRRFLTTAAMVEFPVRAHSNAKIVAGFALFHHSRLNVVRSPTLNSRCTTDSTRRNFREPMKNGLDEGAESQRKREPMKNGLDEGKVESIEG